MVVGTHLGATAGINAEGRDGDPQQRQPPHVARRVARKVRQQQRPQLCCRRPHRRLHRGLRQPELHRQHAARRHRVQRLPLLQLQRAEAERLTVQRRGAPRAGAERVLEVYEVRGNHLVVHICKAAELAIGARNNSIETGARGICFWTNQNWQPTTHHAKHMMASATALMGMDQTRRLQDPCMAT